jgi:hypothetical protein
MQRIKSHGIVRVSEKEGKIVVDMAPDILDYYGWLITHKYWIKLQKPLHDAHITVVSTKYHKNIDWKSVEKYHNQQVEFEYDPNMVQGGYTKGFIMFYLKVFSDAIDKIKDDAKVIENDNYKGLHLTLANSKGSKPRLYWPEMIQIKEK